MCLVLSGGVLGVFGVLSEKSKIYKELEQKLQKAEKELQAKGVEPIDFDSKCKLLSCMYLQ